MQPYLQKQHYLVDLTARFLFLSLFCFLTARLNKLNMGLHGKKEPINKVFQIITAS